MERQYKDSGIEWIGRIPREWKMQPLVIYFAENNKPNSDLYSINALQFKYGEIIQKPNNGKELSDKDRELLEKYTVVAPNDIIVNGLNLNYDLKSLRIAKVREDGIITSAYIVLRPRNGANASYYNYYLKALDFQKIFHGMGVGIRLTLSYNELRSMLIPVPNVQEQQRIVDYLDKKCEEIDSLVELQEQMIAQLTEYKQSVITEAVTKGLDPTAPLVSSGIDWIGDIPKGWKVNKINRLFRMIGSGTTPNSSDDEAYMGTINWLQSGDINGGILTEAKNQISEAVLSKYAALSIYRAPFIIVAMYGASVGNISISQIDACVNQACCVMSKPKINLSYAFYAMKSAQHYLIFKAVGGGQPNISQYTLRQLWIPEPSFSEQQAISSYLDKKCGEIDDLIAMKQKKIETLKEYKKSMIYEAVTGKIEIS